MHPSYPTTKMQEEASNEAWAAFKYLCPVPDFSKWNITRPRIYFVDNLVDGSVAFEGSKLIDSRDLVTLRGDRPTSEENYLTNFVI